MRRRIDVATPLSAGCAEAAAWLDHAIAVDPGNEELEFKAVFQMLRGDVHASLGQSTEAKACYESFAAACHALNRPLAALEMQAGLARLAFADGGPQQAKACIAEIVRQFEAEWRPERSVMDPLRVMLTCRDVLAAAGDVRSN